MNPAAYTSEELAQIEKIKRMAQFPHSERKQNYQSYYLRGEYVDGSRKTLYRFDEMRIPKDLTGQSVLDLGCNLGSMACETYLRGARNVMGIDYEKDYIECANDLARLNHFKEISFRQMDLTKPKEVVRSINAHYHPDPIGIVFALSLYKHVKESLWRVLEGLRWKVCYLESHNAPEGLETGHVKEMTAYLNGQTRWKTEYLGQTHDRSPRCVWKIECLKQPAEKLSLLDSLKSFFR